MIRAGVAPSNGRQFLSKESSCNYSVLPRAGIKDAGTPSIGNPMSFACFPGPEKRPRCAGFIRDGTPTHHIDNGESFAAGTAELHLPRRDAEGMQRL